MNLQSRAEKANCMALLKPSDGDMFHRIAVL